MLPTSKTTNAFFELIQICVDKHYCKKCYPSLPITANDSFTFSSDFGFTRIVANVDRSAYKAALTLFPVQHDLFDLV